MLEQVSGEVVAPLASKWLTRSRGLQISLCLFHFEECRIFSSGRLSLVLPVQPDYSLVPHLDGGGM